MNPSFTGLTAAALLLTGCFQSDKVTTPLRKDIVQVVYASGKIYPVNHIVLAPKVSGYVEKVLVKNGDVVPAGAPLVVLSNPNSETNVAIARENLALSEQYNRTDAYQLNAAWQDVQTAYARFRLDSINYTRQRNLWDQDISTRAALDAARTQADVSLRTYRKNLDSYRNLRAKTSTDVRVARRQLQLQLNNKSDYVLTAPVAGRVYDVPIKEGQLLSAGNPAVDFGNASAFEAELDVDESDIGLVRVGQQVVLNAEAYEGKPIYTTVGEIEPSVVPGNKTTRVKASLAPDNLPLFSGMSVEANIVITEKKNALVVPAEYVNADGTVVLKKGKKRVPVRTGIKDVQYVEILSGLDTQTEIIKQ